MEGHRETIDCLLRGIVYSNLLRILLMTFDIRAGNCGHREQYCKGVDKVDSCHTGAV